MDSKMQVCVGILEIYLELYISVKLRKALYKKKKHRTWLDVLYAHFNNSGHNYDLRFEKQTE